MIILLDTSTPICKLSFVEGDWRYDDAWQADRTLAKGLLAYVHTKLKEHDKTWRDISGIGVFAGPGSFTGLRIGLTVMNTLASSERIPIVGSTADGWQANTLARLDAGENDGLVMPFYGSDAHITAPRK